MDKDLTLIQERRAQIGQLSVGRLLPTRARRQIGPFTFIDHMGPGHVKPDRYIDVDQHPHIGLSTLTYLLQGALEHRDSLGNEVIVRPGDVSFMTAGRGITHTERTPQAMRDGRSYPIHGYQIWIALPKELEEMEPAFQYQRADQLPALVTTDYRLTLLAGEAFGLRSPLNVFSPLFMLDLSAQQPTTLQLREQLQQARRECR